ncbi:glycerol-3-phosphate phosphatase-like [Diprion similis]|uniref:glycerol-3-phosphate phosphatase-like n=1 Tax=Diprion similis TaxID=362088 RepID=UPI001EF85FBE|nr:glycerol-3-phosphate phosphatase-like [Diprion similis]
MSDLAELSLQSSGSIKKPQDLRQFTTQQLYNFLDSFDTILSDCDGVLWNCHTPIPGALATLKELQDMGKNIYFVSNNSTLSMKDFLKKLHTQGFPAKKEQIIIPSLVVVWYLKSIDFKGEAYVIGTEPFKNVLRENGIKVAPPEPDSVKEDLAEVVKALQDVPSIKAIIHDFEPNYSWMKIMRSIVSLRRDDCLYIAAALDNKVAVGAEHPLLGTKVFTDIVTEFSGREPTLTGKPSKLLKQYVYKNCSIADPKRCIFVGDTIQQDMGFAKLCGFKKLFVSSGVTSLEEVLKEEHLCPELYIPSIGGLLPLLKNLPPENAVSNRKPQ